MRICSFPPLFPLLSLRPEVSALFARFWSRDPTTWQRWLCIWIFLGSRNRNCASGRLSSLPLLWQTTTCTAGEISGEIPSLALPLYLPLSPTTNPSSSSLLARWVGGRDVRIISPFLVMLKNWLWTWRKIRKIKIRASERFFWEELRRNQNLFSVLTHWAMSIQN